LIYVMVRPETVLERLKFLFWGIAPTIACDMIRFGPVVECIHTSHNSCTGRPIRDILGITWDECYSEAVVAAKAEYMEAMAVNMGAMGLPPSGAEEQPKGDEPDVLGYR